MPKSTATNLTSPDVLGYLGALNDPVRLRALNLLVAEELSVGEVARALQLPQSTVSRHLKILLEGGWLVRRSERTATYYRLVPDELSVEALSLWNAVREPMAGSIEAEDDLRRLSTVLSERKTDSLSFFGRVAGEWDAVRGELFGEGFLEIGLLDLLPHDWVVADLGCGTANAAERLAGRVERVLAIDQSEPMLTAAKQRLKDALNEGAMIEFVHAPLESLPLEDASIDAAVCSLVLHHIEDPAAVIAETARVLRTDRGGGILLLIDMHRHDRDEYRREMGHKRLGFGTEEIEDMFADAGFERPRMHSLPVSTRASGPGLFVAKARVKRDGANAS